MSPDIITYGAAGLAFIAITALGFAFAGGSRGKQSRRLKSISDGKVGSGKQADVGAMRRKQMDASIKSLRDREEAIRQQKAVGKTIEDRIKMAGFSFPVSSFHIASAVIGVAAGVGAFVAGARAGYELMICVGAAFGAGFGLPRWFLGMAIKGRQKKFLDQFADALDVIVRGVKSGLPLNECLKMIARESSQPLGGEFQVVCDALAMGMTVPQALERMYARVPIQEVNFFNIVLAIQQKAGGNLSEALGNLSTVLRSRKLLREKIKALSSEAKASAMILGALPIIVMLLVYMTTPAYIMTLFTAELGHFILLIAAALMGIGIYIMRSMINFNF
jgi:tight adherence protein B